MKSRVNLTLGDGVLKLAERVMEARKFDNLSPLIEQLIREEWERRSQPNEPINQKLVDQAVRLATRQVLQEVMEARRSSSSEPPLSAPSAPPPRATQKQ
jgi:hypothetical protein